METLLTLLFIVLVLNSILIWDLMNRTRRLIELHNKAALLITKIAYTLRDQQQ